MRLIARAATVAGAAAMLMLGVTASAQAADVTSFRLSYGNSVATGQLNWLNRSVSFQGNNHVASGCRYVEIFAYLPNGDYRDATSSKFCVGMEADNTRPFAGNLDFDGSGSSPSKVDIYYREIDGGAVRVVDSVTCTRSGCS